MNLIKVNALPSIFNTMDGVVDSLFNNHGYARSRDVKYNVIENEKNYSVFMEIPGIEKEDISVLNFSDESTIRALSKNKNIKFTEINRNVDAKVDWIDRSWWSIDERKMNKLGYVTCNFLRPFSSNFSKIQPVVEFIFEKQVSPSSTIFKLKERKWN